MLIASGTIYAAGSKNETRPTGNDYFSEFIDVLHLV